MLYVRLACLTGPALELGPETSVVRVYLKAPLFTLTGYFTKIYLKPEAWVLGR